MNDRQSLSPFEILRVFAASLALVFGIGLMFRADYWYMFMGAVFASCGLTFFALLWLYGRRSS
jgi:hypothetical protein